MSDDKTHYSVGTRSDRRSDDDWRSLARMLDGQARGRGQACATSQAGADIEAWVKMANIIYWFKHIA